MLRNARLIDSERRGAWAIYRLAEGPVLHLWLPWRSVAASRLAEVSRIVDEFVVGPTNRGNLTRPELQQMIDAERVFLIDVRPSTEFSNGHLPGAVSVPL